MGWPKPSIRKNAEEDIRLYRDPVKFGGKRGKNATYSLVFITSAKDRAKYHYPNHVAETEEQESRASSSSRIAW